MTEHSNGTSYKIIDSKYLLKITSDEIIFQFDDQKQIQVHMILTVMSKMRWTLDSKGYFHANNF